MKIYARLVYAFKILTGEKGVVGRYVKARLYSTNGTSLVIRAKVDTGAFTTSIDQELATQLGLSSLVELAENPEFKKFVDKPQEEIKQKILKLQTDAFNTFKIKYPQLSAVKIIISSNGVSIRPNTKVTVQFGGRKFETDVNISDRTHLKNRCIIGRRSLKRFLVDTTQ